MHEFSYSGGKKAIIYTTLCCQRIPCDVLWQAREILWLVPKQKSKGEEVKISEFGC